MTQAPAKTPAPVKVLVVDDSAVVRQLLTRHLSQDPDLCVVGSASDAYAARDRIIELQPDVITLDIQMPRMDGITFLRSLMKYHPIPVIILSSLAAAGAPAAIDALAAGAVDVVPKPGLHHNVDKLLISLTEKIKIAAKSRPHLGPLDTPSRATGVQDAPPDNAAELVFALGASTGGVQALTDVLGSLPAGAPGTVVVQHMPPGFTASFARRLNDRSAVEVKEAADGDMVQPGRVLIAPGGLHMLLRRAGKRFSVALKDGPEVHHQRPSVHALFESVARWAGPNAVGALLTGMGADGAQGLLNMRRAGARTIAQDEATSIVFGMPAEAIKCGAAEQVVPLHQITHVMMQLARQINRGAASVAAGGHA